MVTDSLRKPNPFLDLSIKTYSLFPDRFGPKTIPVMAAHTPVQSVDPRQKPRRKLRKTFMLHGFFFTPDRQSAYTFPDQNSPKIKLLEAALTRMIS